MVYPHLTPDKWQGMWKEKPAWWDAAVEMEVPVTVGGPYCPDHGWVHTRKRGRSRWVCTFGLHWSYTGYAKAHWQFAMEEPR